MPGDAPEIARLLYEDAEGDVVGLDEVQLLDPVPTERIPATRALLRRDDLSLAYQAALVLTAWGDPEGLARVEEFVDTRIDLKTNLAPHRIWGYDNVYDVPAQAVGLYALSSDAQAEDRRRILRKILGLYGVCFFESGLKAVLLRGDIAADLLPDVRAALERAMAYDRAYQASRLLPILARWEGEAARPLVARLAALPPATPDPQANVAEALGHLPGPESPLALARPAQSPVRSVWEEARRSLAGLNAAAAPGEGV